MFPFLQNQKVVNTRTARLAAATPRIDTMASESGFPASRRPFAIKDVPRPWIVPKDPVYVGSENQLAESLSNRISNHISIQLDREQRFNSVTESDFSDIEIIEPLGQGSFGVVHLAKTKKNGFFALKELEPGTSGKAIETEISVLALGKTHPFINQIYFVTKSQDRTYLGLEYLCGGDLWYHLSLGPFTESRIRFYMAEIVLGLQILHGHGIVHRDLNLCNIILDAEGHVKLADFGLSIEGVTQGEKPAKSRCGTLGYMAPEVTSFRLIFYDYSVRPSFVKVSLSISFRWATEFPTAVQLIGGPLVFAWRKC